MTNLVHIKSHIHVSRYLFYRGMYFQTSMNGVNVGSIITILGRIFLRRVIDWNLEDKNVGIDDE